MSESEQPLAANAVDYVVEDNRISSQPQDEGEEAIPSSPIEVDDESSAHDVDEFSQHEEDASDAMMDVGANTASFIQKVQLASKRRATALPVIPLPAKVIGGIARTTTGRQCNCKRSNCLKLYCDCFQGGVYCREGVCNCDPCHNIAAHEDERLAQLLISLEKNPNSFRSKQSWMASMRAGEMNQLLTLSNGTTAAAAASLTNPLHLVPQTKETLPVARIRHGGNASMPMESATMAGRSGCNCKKSNCLKKYCECFTAAICCTPSRCFCLNCGNIEGNPARIRLMEQKKRRRSSSSAVEPNDFEATICVDIVSPGSGSNSSPVDDAAAKQGKLKNAPIEAGLPALAYAIPTKVVTSAKDSGAPFPALSFGSTNLAQIVDPVTATMHISPQPAAVATQRQRPSARRSMVIGRSTELEVAWKTKTATVGNVFKALRREARKRGGAPQLPNAKTKKSMTIREKGIHIAGAKLLETIQSDMQQLARAVDKAERNTIKYLNSQKVAASSSIAGESSSVQDSKQNLDTSAKKAETMVPDGASDEFVDAATTDAPLVAVASSDALDESALRCSEVLEDHPNGSELSDAAIQQLTILGNQDVALLRELASIMRKKTLHMAKARIRDSHLRAGK